jgi:hypothetical protein
MTNITLVTSDKKYSTPLTLIRIMQHKGIIHIKI